MAFPTVSMNTRKLSYRIFVGVVAVMVLWAASATSASAQDVEKPSAFSQMTSKLNPANWKMPSFSSVLPKTNEKERIIERKDSFVDEVTGTAKNSWQRTKAALNPMKLLPAGNKTPSPEKKEPGFFSRLFSPPAASQNSETVTDFLKQDRIAP